MKRIGCILLTAAALCVLSACAALPGRSGAYSRGEYTWMLSPDKAVLTGYSGDRSEVTVPAEAAGRPVVGIGEEAFANCTRLERVVLPQSLVSIGRGAFQGCRRLAQVQVDHPLQVENNAFLDTALMNENHQELVMLPGGTLLCWQAVDPQDEPPQEIVLPETVKSIAGRAFFANRRLWRVWLPEGLEYADAQAFLYDADAYALCREGTYAQQRLIELKADYQLISDDVPQQEMPIITPGRASLEDLLRSCWWVYWNPLGRGTSALRFEEGEHARVLLAVSDPENPGRLVWQETPCFWRTMDADNVAVWCTFYEDVGGFTRRTDDDCMSCFFDREQNFFYMTHQGATGSPLYDRRGRFVPMVELPALNDPDWLKKVYPIAE
ncbi:MAG: leucine-rich repeat protein [Eubacteriales bacterium]|nr:leucine-rich repeat protein [Eubacteriales bacterium]